MSAGVQVRIVDDRSIGMPMLRPMVPAVFSKPSADVNVKPPIFRKNGRKRSFVKHFKKVKNGVRKTM